MCRLMVANGPFPSPTAFSFLASWYVAVEGNGGGSAREVQGREELYRPTGRPRRTSLPLACHRNATNRTRSISSARHSSSRWSKVGLAATKAAALRIKLNVEGCGIVAAPVHAPSRAPFLPPRLLSHNLPFPRVH
jgi:hypothetical protein